MNIGSVPKLEVDAVDDFSDDLDEIETDRKANVGEHGRSEV